MSKNYEELNLMRHKADEKSINVYEKYFASILSTEE
jgi:hypothetical protein